MKDNFEELELAARRGELSTSEAQELERAFEEMPEERIWHKAGQRFDDEEAQARSTEVAENRLLERVLAGRPDASAVPLRRPRRVRPAVLLVAAAVMAVSAAGAVLGIVRLNQARPSEAPPAPSDRGVRPLPKKPTLGGAPVFSAPPEVAAEPPASTAVSPGPVLRPDASAEPAQTAAELLSLAGRARRKGETARAIALLGILKERFPASAEAKASDITLGMLHLETSASSMALRDFERYLGRSPHGERAADALWGRAKALIALGRRSEAEDSLRQLLARYPQSPFSSAARAELHRDQP